MSSPACDAIARSPLAAAFATGFDGDPSRVAILGADGAISWQAVERAARATARSIGGRGGPVGVLGVTNAELLISTLAAAMAGRPACTLHGDWSDVELAAALRDAGVEEVLTRRPTLPADAAIRRPPAVAAARAADEEDADDVPVAATSSGASSGGAAAGDDPLFYVGFTSGSSGRPKPFARRQRSWSRSFDPAARLFSVTPETEVVLAGSLQHSHFLFGAMLGWSQGAPVRLYERFEPARVARDLRTADAAVLYLVPTMLAALDGAGIEPLDRVRCVVVSGAKMEPHHWDAAARLFPAAQVDELYGASETSFVTVNRRGFVADDPGYVGMPFPGVELAIRPRAEDEPGHGMVHVRSAFLFEGYLDDGALVAGVPPDGFVTAGDVGTIRPDGALSLRGRSSNLVITGGKNVHPEEVEAALVAHPGVAECVIVGLAHRYWGEELVGCVVAAGGAVVAPDELRRWLRDRVAAYKVPKRWLAVERLPRTANGKLDRRRARLLAAQAR